MRRSRERRIPICSPSPYRTEHRIVDGEENILSFTKTFDPRWESHVYINAFRVLEQGQGIGTRLMLRLAQEIRDERTIHLIYGTQRDPLGRPYRIRLHIPDSQTRIYVASDSGIDHPAFGIVQESPETSGITPLYLETRLL